MSKLIDLDDAKFAPSEGGGRIRSAGIHTKIKLVSISLIDKPANVEKNKQAYTACEFVFENEQGEQHKELFMKPVSDPTLVKPDKTTKWYDNVNNRKEHTRSSTVEEHIRIMNNEFAHFLIDLGGALGYNTQNVKQALSQARDFKDMVEIFKSKFPPSPNTYINLRLLWQNNDPYNGQPGSSWLKIYFSRFPMYYPFGDDMFEPYAENRVPGIEVKDYYKKIAMVEKYPYVRQQGPATNDAIVPGTAPVQSSGMPAPVAVLTPDDDPF